MIKYILDGEECNPQNKQEVQYVFSFSEDQDKTRLELDVSSLIFVREDMTRINQWRSTYGDYVGMPLDIEYSDGTVIKYILDFTKELSEKNRSIECGIIRYKGWDHFFKRAKGLSFNTPNIGWSQSDFRLVDYVIVPPDQLGTFLTLSVSIFVLSKELAVAIEKIGQNTRALIHATTPATLVPPEPNYGAIITLAIQLALTIAYTIAIIVALIQLATRWAELVFPQVRQYRGITYKRLIEKSVNYLGYTLESSLLDSLSDLVILPVPLREPEPKIWQEIFTPNSLSYTNGYPSASDTIPTLKLALDELGKLKKAEVRVIDGIVKIETREFFEQNANQQILETFNIQPELQDDTGINSEDQYKRLVALYQTDPVDINTYDDTEGTVSEVSSEIINSPDPELELLEGYDEIRMNLARGTRRNELTWLEEAAKDFLSAIDFFTGGDLSSVIEDRKKILQVSNQYFSVTKLIYCQGSKLHPDQNDFIGTDSIIQAHESSSIVNNQKTVKKEMPLALTESEIFNILDNNFVILNNSQTIEVVQLKWSEESNVATIDYTVKKQAVNVETITI
jgi:hypothetical protein